MQLNEVIIAQSVRRYRECGVAAHARTRAIRNDAERGTAFTPQKRKDIYRELVSSTHNPQIAADMLERILAGNDLTGVNYLGIGTRAATSVCRVNLRSTGGQVIGYGTGFLVAPGVVMTNNHVLESDLDAGNAILEFNYELDLDGRDRQTVCFALNPASGQFITDKMLDFSLAAVAPRSIDNAHGIDEFGFLPLHPRPGKSFEGEYLTIIQHPGGERKQVCVRENKLIKYLENTLWYETDTAAGSSGSPVFNGFWEVVALHHMGVPATDNKGRKLATDGSLWDETMGEAKLKWLANEGIRISKIVAFLQDNNSSDPVGRSVLNISSPTAPSVRPPLVVAPTSAISFGVEKVVINQTNYDKRPGYQEDFLGDDDLRIPLPRLSAAN